MIPTLIIFSILNVIVFGDVITLRKGKNISCVLTDDTQSGIYLTLKSRKLLPQNLTFISWEHIDWIEGNNTKHLFKPVTDSRWNEFSEFDALGYYPSKKRINLSLSVCSPETYIQFEVMIRSSSQWIYIPVSLSVNRKPFENCSWSHFTIWSRYNKLLMSSEYDTITVFSSSESTIEKSWFRFKQFPSYLVKSHSYDFFWSDTPASMDEASSFEVQSSESNNICLNFFASIDEECELDIVLVSHKVNFTKTIKGFNKPEELKLWQNYQITFNFTGTGEIYLIRRQTWQPAGFWAIDKIRYCTKAVVCKTTLDTDDEPARCRQIQDKQYKPIGPQKYLKAGCLGNKCAVTCRDILGQHYNYCQEHQICFSYGLNCFCSWGYKGDACKEECTPGSWGIDCMHQCEEHCLQCNRYNGTCGKGLRNSNISTSGLGSSMHISPKPSKSDQITEVSSSILKGNEKSHEISPSVVTSLAVIENSIQKKTSSHTDFPISSTNSKKLSTSNNIESNSSSFGTASTLGNILALLCILVTSVTIFMTIYFLNTKCRNREGSHVENLGPSKFSVVDFDSFIKKASTDDAFSNQFSSLTNDSNQECSIGLAYRNMRKNYDSINIPYDQSRIVLKPMRDIGTDGDYINASYIDGWGRSRAYIVTQGPKASTMADFWRMIWQHDVKIIVMATQFRENMERKSFEYFPTYLNAVLPVEGFGIKLVAEESSEFYHKRMLEIYYERYHKTITHYQLKCNPECGKSLYPNNLVPLVKTMNENYSRRQWSPIVVHCHLGVERSAILILSDLAVEMAKKEGYVDVYDLAKILREQRPNMITSAKDYLLAHLVISECLIDESSSRDPLRRNLDTLSIERELEYLNTCTWHDNLVCSTPFSAVQSYEHKANHIFLKQPQSDDEIEHFWLTVLHKKIERIIFLNDCPFDIWPFRKHLSRRRICTVNIKNSVCHSYFVKHLLLIKEQDIRTTTLYEEEIQFYQLLNWSFDTTTESSMETFIQFVEDCRKINPIPDKVLICCSDGITGCGLFIATTFIIEKYINEVEYDIFNAIRNIRRTNSQFMSKKEELCFLYQMVLVYSQKFDPYNNID